MLYCLLILVTLLSACGQTDSPAAPAAKTQGRAETQSIRNTDAIGMSGSSVGKKVDAVLDTNDQRMDQLDAALAEQEKGK